MRRLELVLVALVVWVVALNVVDAGAGALRPRYAVELEVTPLPGQAGAYESVVVVRDLVTHAVLVQPKIRSLAGQKAEMKSPEGRGDVQWLVTIEIGKEGTLAKYSVELRDRDQVLTSYEATARLVGS